MRLEVKAMRDVRHPNLVNFVGACCNSPHVCILMQLVPKGSLDDILAMGYLQLDWKFKYSLLKVLSWHRRTSFSNPNLLNEHVYTAALYHEKSCVLTRLIQGIFIHLHVCTYVLFHINIDLHVHNNSCWNCFLPKELSMIVSTGHLQWDDLSESYFYWKSWSTQVF